MAETMACSALALQLQNAKLCDKPSACLENADLLQRLQLGPPQTRKLGNPRTDGVVAAS